MLWKHRHAVVGFWLGALAYSVMAPHGGLTGFLAAVVAGLLVATVLP